MSWASIDGPIKFKHINRQLRTTTLIMVDLQGTEDLPYHQRQISRVPLANLTLSGRLTLVRLVSISRVCPLRLLRAASMVHSENLSIALSRYDFIRGFMRWCDVIFLLFWEKFRPDLADCFGTQLGWAYTILFGGAILLPILAAKAPLSVFLAATALWDAGFCWLILIYLREGCPSLLGPIGNWLSRAFTSTVDSPSGPATPLSPLPVSPFYADCTSDTPIRFCNLDAFCLPILRRKKGGYEALILKPAARGDGYYERVGTFAHPNPPVMKMLESAPQVSFILTQNWFVNPSAWYWLAIKISEYSLLQNFYLSRSLYQRLLWVTSRNERALLRFFSDLRNCRSHNKWITS